MIDWIGWTKCPACGHMEKEVFQHPEDPAPSHAGPGIRCPKCGQPARLINFPAFEVETIEVNLSDALRDEMEDW